MKKIFTLAASAAALAMTGTSAFAANIVETAASTGQFNTLIAAAKAAGLAGALSDTQNITVFAPTDDAFAKLPAGTVEDLLKPENKDQLAAILTYHVLPRELASTDLPNRNIPVRTLNTAELLRVTKSGGGVTVNNANVVSADIRADNGIVHVIDTVLLPGTNRH